MIRIADIERESIVDGEGIRYVIFTQGCSHNCLGCHNPESHDFNGGKLVSEDEILDDINNSPLIDGITLSGGDPFFQAKALIPIVKACKEKKLTIWAYTGFTFEEFQKFMKKEKCDRRINSDMIKLLRLTDVLVDGPFILAERTLSESFKGSKNQRILDVKKSIKNKKPIIYEVE